MRSSGTRFKLGRRSRERRGNSYEKMMKTLLLQNQQIIIQQQNMMFMVMKQLQPPQQQQQPSNNTAGQPQANQQQPQPTTQQHTHHQSSHQHQQQQHQHHHHHQHQQQQQQQQQQLEAHQLQHHHIHEEQSLHGHQLFSQAASSTLDTQQQLQQVASQLQENLGNYLTPAASEQDPINDKQQEEDDLAALLEGDGLLHNNLLYNPSTDIGSITPYKSHQQQHQTPSYYSSGGESLTTPRVEQQRQPMTTNINQNVVKNLADSFKSPTKPKINVQIMSGSATGSMKNSKAKIIQRMNISEFLRHVHPETDEPQKNASQ